MRYNGTQVLREVTLEFGSAQFVAVVGPNGAGKSTLLGILAGLRPNYTGRCEYAGTELRRWNRRAFARQVSFVPQSLRIEFPFTAEQVVLMGRTPHCDGLFESPEDFAAVQRSMATTDTLPFRGRDFRSLSGGERQRVILASALAQQPKTLLLDEPTTFLDLQHQISIYRLLRDLSRDAMPRSPGAPGGISFSLSRAAAENEPDRLKPIPQGILHPPETEALRRDGLLVIAATHDLNLAASFADRVVVLDAGRVAADAAPSQVLIPSTIREVFGVESAILRTPDGRPWIFYGE